MTSIQKSFIVLQSTKCALNNLRFETLVFPGISQSESQSINNCYWSVLNVCETHRFWSVNICSVSSATYVQVET